MKNYFEYLDKHFPYKDEEINSEFVAKLSENQIIDMSEELSSLISAPSPKDKTSIFNHCASITLSGGRGSCWQYDCRKKRLNQVARIAALYSDKVYINNYFSYFNSHNINYDSIHEDFYDDLLLIYQIRPLLENGIISIVREVPDHCPHCVAGAIAGDPNNNKRINQIDNAVSKLAQEYFTESIVYIELEENDTLGFTIEAPPPYFAHGTCQISSMELPDIVLNNPILLKKLQTESKVKLNKELQEEFGFHYQIVEEIKQQIFYETYVNKALDTTYLTENAIHIKFLEEISENPNTPKRNSIISNHLTSLVPFAEDVPIDKLLSLRKREEESFSQFRASINTAIFETKSLQENFNELKAKEIYSDIIYPNLQKLELNVKEAKKDLIKTTYRSIIGVAGAISFGMYTGILPNEAIAMAKAIGFGKVSNDLITKFMALGDAKTAIKTDDLYFLWEVKKMSEKEKLIKQIKSQ